MDKPLKRLEFKVALDSLNDSTPGNDGLTVGFYKTIWNNLACDLTESHRESLEKGQLTESQRQAVIILLEKKDKSKELIKNLRPISLLNIDYKILTKALANRVKPLMPNLINPIQTAYIKRRNINDNIRLIDDIMQITNIEDLPGMICGVDFEKAFD